MGIVTNNGSLFKASRTPKVFQNGHLFMRVGLQSFWQHVFVWLGVPETGEEEITATGFQVDGGH